MEIRELREGDGPGLSRLMAEVQAELPEAMTFGVLSPERMGETVAWKLEAVRSGAVADLAAVEGGEVVADCEILCDGAEGIAGIIVRGGARGKGIGKALLEGCMARARDLGVRTVRARVMASNSRAVSFFRRMGFEERGRNRDGTVLMGRALP